jgi:sulfhydrogenase subunit beta (sulfur reductase)
MDEPSAVFEAAGVSVVERQDLQKLLDALMRRGYAILGPIRRDHAILYDELKSAEELPEGWTAEHKAGSYRLKKRKDKALFGFVAGPNSWKQFFHPPRLLLFSGERKGGEFEIAPPDVNPPRLALLGVRPCEIQALKVQDKVFLGGPSTDAHYALRRKGTFVVAVNCSEPGGTCFCASLGTGPRAAGGFDLALTEIVEKKRHFFAVETGSEIGAEVLGEVPHSPASREDTEAASAAMKVACQRMGRALETEGLKEILYGNLESPVWEEVSTRCLCCTNCTLVCPTCFCTTVEDVTDLSGRHAERHRRWDSCFTLDFSYIYGGHVRRTGASRYRQWLTHKLGTWQDQFGTLGCVGCGRCITWCPAGIDITEEAQRVRENHR